MKVCPTTYSDLEYAQSRKCTMNGVTEGNNFSATPTSDVLVPERCPNTLDLRGHWVGHQKHQNQSLGWVERKPQIPSH